MSIFFPKSDTIFSEKMSDLPSLNDARRVARWPLVLDELYHAQASSIPFDMSENEFIMCGGHDKQSKRYSLYRQLVYANRDFKAFLMRTQFPVAASVAKANGLYSFYDTKIVTDEKNDPTMKTKDFNRVLRLLIVFRKCRKAIMNKSTHHNVHNSIKRLRLSYEEFLLCGGRKLRTSGRADSFDFEIQLGYAVRDLKNFLNRGRLPPPCVLEKALKQITRKNQNVQAKKDLEAKHEADAEISLKTVDQDGLQPGFKASIDKSAIEDGKSSKTSIINSTGSNIVHLLAHSDKEMVGDATCLKPPLKPPSSPPKDPCKLYFHIDESDEEDVDHLDGGASFSYHNDDCDSYNDEEDLQKDFEEMDEEIDDVEEDVEIDKVEDDEENGEVVD